MADMGNVCHPIGESQEAEIVEQGNMVGDTPGQYPLRHQQLPEIASGVPWYQMEDGQDVREAEHNGDELMQLAPGSSSDHSADETAASPRNVEPVPMVTFSGTVDTDNNQLRTGDHIIGLMPASHNQVMESTGSPPGPSNRVERPRVPGRGMLPTISTTQSFSIPQLANDDFGKEILRITDSGSQSLTDSVLEKSNCCPTGVSMIFGLSPNQNQSPFPFQFSSLSNLVPENPLPASESQLSDCVGSSQSTTTPWTDPVQQQLPQPVHAPTRPPNVVANDCSKVSLDCPPFFPHSTPRLFSYSLHHIAGLRDHVLQNELKTWLVNKFSAEISDEILDITQRRGAKMGSIQALALQAGLAPQDAYFGDTVEEMFGTWFDICVVDELYREYEEFLPADFDEVKERTWFVEGPVRAYMQGHPADR